MAYIAVLAQLKNKATERRLVYLFQYRLCKSNNS